LVKLSNILDILDIWKSALWLIEKQYFIKCFAIFMLIFQKYHVFVHYILENIFDARNIF